MMSLLIKIYTTVFSFFLVFLFGLSVTSSAYAAVTLSGNVQDSSGTAINGATVSVNDVANSTATTDSDGNYSLSLTEGAYNVQVAPPSGSGFTSAIALSQNINSNTILNFILTPAGTIRLQGKLLDPNGNGIPNQTVNLDGNGISPSVQTDSNGNYMLQATPGTYYLNFYGNAKNAPAFTGPTQYWIESSNFSLNQNTILNLTLPTKRVDIHVQNDLGEAVGDVTLSTPNNQNIIQSNLSIGGTITNGKGSSTYITSTAYVKTDSNGNATMWLYPNSSGTASYTVVASPLSSSNYASTSQSFPVSGNTMQTITVPNKYTIQGKLSDPNGNGIPNQTVNLDGNGISPSVQTDSNGNYTLSVTQGTYYLSFYGNAKNTPTFTGPTQYWIESANFTVNQNMTLNLTIPTKRVDIHVQTSSGVPIENVTLTTPNNQDIIQSNLSIGGGITNGKGSSTYVPSTAYVKTDSNGNATMWLYPNSPGTASYTIVASPGMNTNYISNTLSLNISGDTSQTIVLSSNVSLQGKLTDPNGNGIPNQTVSLSGNNVNLTSQTNTDGNYSFQVIEGTYSLGFYGNANNSPTFTGPTQYGVESSNFLLNQNKTVNLVMPAKKVDIHIQDETGEPIGGVILSTPNNQNITQSNLTISEGITNGIGSSTYVTSTAYLTTNSEGNATMWLFPTSSGSASYTIIASPPGTSNYLQYSNNNVVVVDNQTELIQLQYNHDAPVTTAGLATQHPDSTYSNPTTVTLSASAAAGYTIADTHYKIDGGTTETYIDPFEVTGEGSHVIEYWSVDTSGVPETPKTTNFTIHVNQAPIVDPFAGGTISAGQTFTTSSYFTDFDSNAWTATVDYDDGAGEEPLTLNPDKTFNLSHQYNTTGEYTITVVVRDAEQSTGTTMATVIVITPEPITTTYTSSADTYVRGGSDNRNAGAGTFMRLQSSGNNRSLVQFDQTAMENEIGNKQILSAKLRVTIVDNGNNWGTTGRTIDVHRLIASWTEGNGTENDRGTGAGATWECATDTNIANQSKNCTGSEEWEMGQPNNPSVHPWIETATATQTISNNQSGVVEFDVTSDVASFLNGTNANNGWIIKKTAEGQAGQVSFGTKESSSVPQLVVTYQP